MLPSLAILVDWIIRVFTILVIVDVVLTYFMDPLHPVRRALDRIVEPLLAPIRRRLPDSSPVDLSPVVLVLGLIVFNMIIQALLR
jgi:YggT family protein